MAKLEITEEMQIIGIQNVENIMRQNKIQKKM